jgi:hypothetical protein
MLAVTMPSPKAKNEIEIFVQITHYTLILANNEFLVKAASSVSFDFFTLWCFMEIKWLRYQRVISLKIQVRNTNQRNSIWANTDPWIYRRWDQMPRRSKHPLLINQTRREPVP